jgi:hypothetical protein
MTLAKKAFVLTASLIAIAACSSKGTKSTAGSDQNPTDGSDTNDTPLTADEKFCDDQYKSQLDWVGRCGGYLTAAPSAIERYRKLCARELVAPGAEGLRDARTKCAAARAQAACDAIVKECELPPGGLADGAACAVRSQCQSRFCKLDGSGCGTCTQLLKPGDVCTAPTDCAFGDNEVATCEYAQQNSTTGKCAVWQLVGVGKQCGTNTFCSPGSHCESKSQNGPGTCVADLAEGGTCVDSTSCTPGLACVDKKCAALLGEGDSCSSFDDCGGGLACEETCQKPTYVNSGQECDALRQCGRGICFQPQNKDQNGAPVAGGNALCVAPIADGDPCGPNDQGQVCDFFAQCIGGKCIFGDPTVCK